MTGDSRKGHRQRLYGKVREKGLDSLHDYEVIELLLTLGTPRQDCKGRGKELLGKFGNLKGVMEASPEKLQEIKGIGPNNIIGLKLFQEISERYLKYRIQEQPYEFRSPQAVHDYLFQSMQKERLEVFKVLYLSSANNILDTRELFRGTTDQAVIYPREVVRAALDSNATRLIFAHNHPSGNPRPSEHDIDITKRLKEACDAVDIEVLDHIIIGSSRYYSFREHGLLG